MTENLNVSTFRNGDPIPEAKTKEEWESAVNNHQPAWCYYDNDPKNGAKYGKLYNWYAVSDPRVLAPNGWHIPIDAEWSILENYLGEDAGKKMKNASGWVSWDGIITCSNCTNWNAEYRRKTACHVCKDTRVIGKKTHSGNGTNSSGFSGLPGGLCGSVKFTNVGSGGHWWSSTEYSTQYNSDGALGRDLDNIDVNVNIHNIDKKIGLSVRCLRD
jgi:uncharacterized protein (TIGR02145 family)